MSVAKLRALPYALLGSSRRAALRNALIDRLTNWRQQWSTAASAIAVSVPESPAAGWAQFTHGQGALFTGSVDGTALLQAHVTAGFLPALLGLDCRASEVTSRDVAGQLRAKVLKSLWGELAKGMNAEATCFDAEATTQAARLDAARRQRALPVGIATATTDLCTLILHPRLIELLAPSRGASGAGRPERRQDAIAAQRLRVETVLGEVELPFGELRSLRSGDVIVLDKSLSEPLRLVIETGTRVAAVAIGSAGAMRAVRVGELSE